MVGRSSRHRPARAARLAATLAIGVAVFVVWIAPDLLIKGYRHFWLFDNSVTGQAATSLSSRCD